MTRSGPKASSRGRIAVSMAARNASPPSPGRNGGPDGDLYFSIGDNANSSNAQALANYAEEQLKLIPDNDVFSKQRESLKQLIADVRAAGEARAGMSREQVIDLVNQPMQSALDSLREGLIDLMATDQEFIDAILLGTSQPIRVRKRFDMVRLLVDSVLASRPEQPRCFSLKLKQELHERDARCALCKQHIQHIDDAAVDHIEQYWRGGKTIPENARLAHRYCNTARPRND